MQARKVVLCLAPMNKLVVGFSGNEIDRLTNYILTYLLACYKLLMQRVIASQSNKFHQSKAKRLDLSRE